MTLTCKHHEYKMEKELNHKPFITFGCLIWIASFFGEVFAFQPYSTLGIIISPIITLFGIAHWLKYYRKTRGHYPRFWAVWKENNRKTRKNPFAGMSFMFSHILETWTFTIVGWMGIVLIGFLTFGQSSAFKASKKYCENNNSVIEKTGKIRYYGVLVGGSISTNRQSGSAEFFFTIIGEKGNFSAKSELTKYNGIWEVLELEVN